MRKIFVLALVGLLSSGLAAQDSLKTTMLNEVVTSAMRSEQPIVEVPRSVTVISREVIEKSVYNSVGELLSRAEGIYVVGGNQTPGMNQSLFMRGAGSNQVAVMIDGARITDPSTPNAVVDLSELSLTNIERIEIIRGAHSTLYGGAAIGGVVNIITKKGQQPGFHGLANAQAGTFGSGSSTLTENLGLNYTLKNGLYFNGSLMNQNVNGLNASIDTVKTPGVYKKADKDGFRKTDGYAKIGFKNDHWDIFTSYKRIDQRADIDNGAYQDDDNNYVDFNRNLVNYKIGYQFSEHWKLAALGSWSNSVRWNENDSSKINFNGDFDRSYFKGEYKGKLLTDEIQLNYQNKIMKAMIGSGRYAEDMSFNTYYFSNAFGFPFESVVNYDTVSTMTKTTYVFGQASVDVKNFSLSVGSRFSHHSLFGNYWTFEANPSYRFHSTLLYASISSGFNPASLYQLFDPTKGYGAFTSRGNKDLKPEESLSLELGVKKEFVSGSYFTLSAYRTQVKNSIEYVYLWNKNTPVLDLSYADNLGDTYLNISQQTTKGVEAAGHVAIQKFYINANITWMVGQLTVNPEDIDEQHTGGNHVQLYSYGSFLNTEIKSDNLVRRPRVTTYAEIGYRPISNLTLSAVYRYAGLRFDSSYDPTLGPYGALTQFKVKNYNLVDVTASWQITKAVSLGLKIENILNEQYQEILGFQTRGRSGYLKIAVKW